MPDEAFISVEAVEALVQFGMPRDYAEKIKVTQGLSRRMTIVTGVMTFILLLLCMFGSVLLMVWFPVNTVIQSLGAVPENAFLIDVESFTSVGFVFVGIMLTGVFCNLLAMSRREFAETSALTNLQKLMQLRQRSWWPVIPGRIIRKIDPQLPFREYLAAYPRGEAWFAGKLATLGLVLCAVFFLWDAWSTTFVTEDGVTVSGHFQSRKFYDWNQVEKLSTGCFRMGKGKRHLRYVLHFKDGQFSDVGPDSSTANTNLAALARIDEILRSHAIPWERSVFPGGVHAGRVQWDIEGFRSCRSQLSKTELITFARVYRLREQDR